MEKRKLGRVGPEVSAIGLGCMSLSGVYGTSDDEAGIRLIHRAIELGVDHFDSSDMYGWGQNEELLGRAIKGRRDGIVIASKFGQTRRPGGANGVDGSPAYIAQACEESLKRLGVDIIDLYYQHRVDPNVPVEDTVGAMARLVEQGKVRHLGLCEARPERIRRAHAVHPIAALQIEYSLVSRDIEKEILPTIRELGIALVAYGVLSRGLISDGAPTSQHAGEIRTRMPRFSAENFPRNMALVRALGAIAREKNASTAQLAFAWIRSRGEDVVPLIGARRRDQLKEALGALDLRLTAADLARVAQAVPAEAVAGTRYLPAVLAHLDSEHAG